MDFTLEQCLATLKTITLQCSAGIVGRFQGCTSQPLSPMNTQPPANIKKLLAGSKDGGNDEGFLKSPAHKKHAPCM